MSVVYKRTIYWLNTKECCGALGVDQNGYIYECDTAPCYRWAAKKKMRFQDLRKFLQKKGKLLNLKKL
jgi:hypothetical protein